MKFHLRPWEATDIDSLVRYANNFEIAKNLTNKFPHPYTEENGRAFIAFANAHTPHHVMAIVINGEAVGGIGVHPKDDIECKNAELGYWIGQPFWGKGVVTAAVKQMIAYGFDNFDINRIFARPFEHNRGSQRVLEKAGFVFEARLEKTLFKNGELLDELIYAVRRQR